MKRTILILSLLVTLSLACSLSGLTGGDDASEQTSPAVSENRCGDDVCDGPETVQNCPEDCQAAGMVADPEESDEEETVSEEQPVPESGYRYVSFSGTIDTTLNTATMGDFTGDAFEYAGAYSIELWFPLDGGEVVQQRNSITLTEYRDLFFGDPECRPCEWNLDNSAFEPVEFALEASLNLNAMEEGDQTADELVYQLVEIPQVIVGGIVQCPCPGSAPGDIFDPAAFPVLTSWFTQKLVNPIHLNAIESNSVEHQSVGPLYYIDIPSEALSYVIVPDLNTP